MLREDWKKGKKSKSVFLGFFPIPGGPLRAFAGNPLKNICCFGLQLSLD